MYQLLLWLLLLLLCLEIFFYCIWSRYWRAAMFRRFPKEVTLCQYAPKDLVIDLREPAYFPQSKWAAWGHHLWKFPLALIQETWPLSRPALQYGGGSSPRGENVLCTRNSNSEACSCPPLALPLTSPCGEFIMVGHSHCSPLQTGG